MKWKKTISRLKANYLCFGGGLKTSARQELEIDLVYALKYMVFVFFVVATLQLCVDTAHYKSAMHDLDKDLLAAKEESVYRQVDFQRVRMRCIVERRELEQQVLKLQAGIKAYQELIDTLPTKLSKTNRKVTEEQARMTKAEALVENQHMLAAVDVEIAKAEARVENQRMLAAVDVEKRKVLEASVLKIELEMKGKELDFKKKYEEVTQRLHKANLNYEAEKSDKEVEMRLQMHTLNAVRSALDKMSEVVRNNPVEAINQIQALRDQLQTGGQTQ